MADVDIIDRCGAAALALAAEKPWRDVTLRDIAARADLVWRDLYGEVSSKTDVVDGLAARFDREAANQLDLDDDASVRERAFDAAMARFDAMEPHRAGLVSILDDVRRDVALTVRGWGMAQRSARWLLELAGVDASGARGFARVQGFAAILARATDAWRRDDAGDLSRTMAQLDRDLRDVEERMSRWPFSKRRSRPDTHEEAPSVSEGAGESG